MRVWLLAMGLLLTGPTAEASEGAAAPAVEAAAPNTKALEKELRKSLPLNPEAYRGNGMHPVPTRLKSKAYRGADGVLIADLALGDGPAAEAGDVVSIHYTMWLLDGGGAFDSSLVREPLEHVVGQRVIAGWNLGVTGMQVGGRRQVLIPAQLGYGERGSGSVIPPNSALLVEMELLSLVERPPAPERPEAGAFAGAAVLPGGVRVLELAPGQGEQAIDGSPVRIELIVWGPDGSPFYSSLEMPQGPEMLVGAPAPDGPPLQGLNEVLFGMRVGGRRMALLPPEVAFGERGMEGRIPPNASVTVYVEVVELGAVRRLPRRPALRADGLRRTASGLRFRIDRAGHGPRPQPGETVAVEYTMWLDDGTVVDSSYDRTHAFSFPLGGGRVIEGFEETVADMNVGEQRVVVIPPGLGYGDRDRGLIPAGSTLTVLIELVSAE